MKSKGVDTSKVEIKSIGSDHETGNEYGLFATQDISQDELILSIPLSLMMTATQASISPSSDIGFLKDDPLIKDMSNLELTMVLLNEYARGKSSKWFDYMSILPERYDTPLYNVSLESLAQLKPSPVYQESCKMIRNICRQYAYFWSRLNSHKNPGDLPAFRRNITFEMYR